MISVFVLGFVVGALAVGAIWVARRGWLQAQEPPSEAPIPPRQQLNRRAFEGMVAGRAQVRSMPLRRRTRRGLHRGDLEAPQEF